MWDFLVFVLVLLFVAMLPIALIVRRRYPIAALPAGPSPWIYVVAALPGLLFFSIFSNGGDAALVLLVLLGLAAFAFLATLWIREIVNLMGLGDDAFPGRHDKILWLALMALLPPIGVPAFSLFRRAYWPAEKPVVDSVTREMA